MHVFRFFGRTVAVPAMSPPDDAGGGSGPSNPRKRRRSRFASAANPAAPAAPVAPPSSALDLSAIPVAPVSTLKINQNAARNKKLNSSLKSVQTDLLETDPTVNPHYDPQIPINSRSRRPPRPDILFLPHGAVTERAERVRRAAQREEADRLFREAMAHTRPKPDTPPDIPPLNPGVLDASRGGGTVPNIEWWDVPFVSSTPAAFAEDGAQLIVRDERMTSYIHRPVSIPSFKPPSAPKILPLMLTEKERKKLRRQRRMEKETERREMIAVGLLPPEPPKVRLSNLMRVLASEAVADPTKVEADVRAQVAERLEKHQADNLSRKKTKDELREKAELKAVKDREAGMRANVYRILSVDNPSHRFKVDVNARQYGLTGALVLYGDCNLVIVEGGVKALRKYKQLLLRRIDWNAPLVSPDNSNPPDLALDSATTIKNMCVMTWEGPIAKSAFESFKIVKLLTQSSVKDFLRKRGMDGQFDTAQAANLAT